MAIRHYIDLWLLELSRDLAAGVSVAERQVLIEDLALLAWSRSEGRLLVGGWS